MGRKTWLSFIHHLEVQKEKKKDCSALQKLLIQNIKKWRKGGINKWMTSLLAYGCNLKSTSLWCRQSVVLCRKRARNSHKTNLAISLCRPHSTRQSGQRRPLTAATSTLLHNVAAAWQDFCGRRPHLQVLTVQFKMLLYNCNTGG